MKKIIRKVCMTCFALSIPLSASYAQDADKQVDTIPEYIEINDDEPLYSLVPIPEEENYTVTGATLAWRDIRPETDPNVTPSRSVTIGLNQYLEVEYPGNEWIYLGEAEETNHVRYYGRKLGRDNTVFTLCSKEAGTVLLHFYCIDPLNGTSISDYLEVVVEDRTTGTSKKAVAPSYAKAFPANQHSNEFDYVTPTVTDVHKEPDTPYTLEVPNPPKENTVAVPKTSSTGKSTSSTSGSNTSKNTGSTTTKPATSSSNTTASTSTSKSTSSSTSTATTKPAATSTSSSTTTAKNTSPATSSSSTSKSTSSSTSTATTTPAATSSSSSTSATKSTNPASSSSSTSSTTATSSTGTTRSANSSA
ncbi:MAG: hypothetical protein J6S91_02565, partial [Treponema sp.]|nr:hypothetical protein [Treponema sp.]